MARAMSTYVRNITDVEDKIIAAAAERGEAIAELTQRTTATYHADMGALNALAAGSRAARHRLHRRDGGDDPDR